MCTRTGRIWPAERLITTAMTIGTSGTAIGMAPEGIMTTAADPREHTSRA